MHADGPDAARQAAVVARVGAVRGGRRLGEMEQAVGEVELVRGGLAPGQVQLQALGHQVVVRRALLRCERFEFLARELGEGTGI